ncbi:hypothetical protein [Desulfovibrio litoralis]|uniref:Uncharacterized protein n=1 Tax=Desulfovibrio litoralis DSM 11393 TaxID=1121455 RepID=A0A1M7SWM3_9BACT|nr:hypothetical protein [Desulfovibrio litoralis]SHN62927.1 hypothetical protein SAMN02745728_01317 [Desulfovibrio litoralis DSM 11393]
MKLIKNTLNIKEKTDKDNRDLTQENHKTSHDTLDAKLKSLLDEAQNWNPAKLMPTKGTTQNTGISSLFWSNPEDATENSKTQLELIRYLEDLRLVLNMPNGAGERVLKRWLATAWNGYPLSLTQHTCPQNYTETNSQLGLLNYCLERRAEISLANPLALVRLNLLESKELSQEFMRSE